jgi:hypothetical protein
MPESLLRRKEGQVSVLIAAFVALAMVMLAFGIDIAHVLVEKRHAQNQADAAALAAGRFLPLDDAGPPCQAIPNCRDNVGVVARDYSQYNGGPAGTGPAGEFEQCNGVITTNCYDTPYKGHKYFIQIRIHDPVQLWFAGVVPGLAGAIKGVNAKAVGTPGAETTTTTTPGTTVDGTTIDGTTVNGTTVDGTTIAGTTNSGTTVAGTTVDGTTVAGTTNAGTTIAGTTVAGTVSTTYSTTVVSTTTPASGNGGIAFVKSTACAPPNTITPGLAAISYSGAPGSSISGLMTNGGLWTAGNATMDKIAIGKLGQPNCDQESGNSVVTNKTGPFPLQDWPIPIPTPPTDPTADCPAANNLNTGSFVKASHPNPGVYCLSAGILTIKGSNVDYSGYTFIAPTIVVSATSSTFSPASGESTVFYNSSGNSLNIQDTNTTTWTTSNTITGAMCLGNASLSFAQAGHPKGVYCLTGTTALLTISSNGADWRGYTFYAPSISTSSTNQKFSPASGESTVFDAYQGSLSIQGNGNTVTGNMFAPNPTNGAATISGGGVGAGSGYIEVQMLSVSGNFATFRGTGPSTPGTVTTSTQTTSTTTTYPGTTNPGSTVFGTTNSGSTTPGTTNSGSTTPGTTTPGSTTSGSTTPGSTTPTTIFPGTTTPGSTQTATTGTTVALNE